MNSSQIILVDSDIFIALRKQEDSSHKRASLMFKNFKDKKNRFIASNYVFSETITVLSQRISHKNAIEFIEQRNNPATFFSIIRLSEKIEELAIDIFKEQTSKNISFVDCANMALLEEKQADLIWSFDEIYKKNKYKTA